ncbi:MAG: replicative DNA helicase [Desulfobacterales bacterium]|nr:replicative DNA helicase [Desulfobacterales bacterium]
MIEQTLPYDKDNEVGLIASCLVSGREVLSEILDNIKPDYFYFTPHKIIFEAIVDLSRQAEAVDITALVGELKDRERLDQVGGISFISSILDVPPPIDIEFACKRIEEKYLLRRSVEKCYAVIKRCHDGSNSFDETMQYFVDAAHSVSDASRAGDTVVPIKQACMDAIDVYGQRYQNKRLITGVESGLKDLDTLTSGFQPGNEIILAGRPGMGKSALALNIMRNAAIKGDGSIMFSLEMPTQQLIDRFVTMETRIDGKKVRVGDLVKAEFLKINDALDKFYNLPIFIDDRGGLTVSEISRVMRKSIKKHPEIKIAIVDHLQLVRGSNPQNRNLELGNITGAFKALAKELRIPIILLSQLNREVERRNNPFKRPRLSDLRDSGSIEQDADDVIFIYRPWVYGDDKDPKDDRRSITINEADCELITAKQRQGPTGIINCMFFDKIQKFENKTQIGPSELYEGKGGNNGA